MIPSQDLGEAVGSTVASKIRDFASLMPRPGWKDSQLYWQSFL